MVSNKVGPAYVWGSIASGKTIVARRIYQQLSDDE